MLYQENEQTCYEEKPPVLSATGQLGLTGWAIVPVKTLGLAKSRLSDRLTPPQRAILMLNLLKHTLAVLQTSGLAGITVVSRDPAVLRTAQEVGVCTLAESKLGLDPTDTSDPLNATLAAVAHRFQPPPSARLENLLILPADLPLLTRADLIALLKLAGPGRAVLATDLHGSGTNGLLLDLATARHFNYMFGPDSFRLHRQNLEALGLEVKLCDRPGLRYDLDYPADFERLPDFLQKSLLQLDLLNKL